MKLLRHKDLIISLSLVIGATGLERMLNAGSPSASILAYFCVVAFALTNFEYPKTLAASVISFQFFILSGGHFTYSFPRDLISTLLFILSCFFLRKLFAMKDQKIKELEESLLQEKANRFTFALSLSKGLKEPLNILRIGSHFLKDKEPGTDKYKKVVNLVDETSEKIRLTIKDVTDTAFVGSGKSLDLKFDEYHLKTIILEGLIPFEKAHPGRFKTELTPMSTKALWNEEGIRRIVSVLCDNAIKYGDGSPIELKLVEDDEHAILTVKNNGPVLSGSELATLFTPFHRMLTQDKFSLSLPLVKAITEAHGGNIKVVSNHDEGTVFQILLPKRHPEASNASP